MLSTAEMDEHYRALMARPELGGVAAEARELVAAGVLTEREAWGIVYSLSVSAVATAAAVTLAVGLAVEHGTWHRMADPAAAAAPSRRRSGSATRSPRPAGSCASRSPIGDVAVQPGDQVLMWLTAANRDLPGPHAAAARPVRPGARQRQAPGLRLRLPPVRRRAPRPRRSPSPRSPRWPSAARSLRIVGPWKRFVGIDDGYVAAPRRPRRRESPDRATTPQLGCRSCRRRLPAVLRWRAGLTTEPIGFRVCPIGSRRAAHGDELAPLSSLDRRRGTRPWALSGKERRAKWPRSTASRRRGSSATASTASRRPSAPRHPAPSSWCSSAAPSAWAPSRSAGWACTSGWACGPRSPRSPWAPSSGRSCSCR